MQNEIPVYHPLIEERLTHEIIGAFYTVYNTLRFGFVERIQACTRA